MITFISSILVFSIIILVHEFGHYKAAKSVGIKVEEFAIGMGPILYQKEKNGTLYSFRAVPLGGFVRMEGEDEDVHSTTSYSSKTVWQRFKTIAAGPFMNFVLALVIFLIIAFTYGSRGAVVEHVEESSQEYIKGLRPGDKVVSINDKSIHIMEDISFFFGLTEPESDHYTMEIIRDGETSKLAIPYNNKKILGITSQTVDGKTTTTVAPTDTESPAYKAGINKGDKVVKINDIPVLTWEDVVAQINLVQSEEVKVTVDRNNELIDFVIVPTSQVYAGFYTSMEKSFVTAIFSSIYKTGFYIKTMFQTIFMLFTGKLGMESLAGPVGVISIVSEAAASGLFSVLNLAAFLSVNIGFMNLLPIPALDGSKLVFLIFEKIRGKKLPAEKEGFVHFIGFVLLISLMIFVTYRDVIRLFRL